MIIRLLILLTIVRFIDLHAMTATDVEKELRFLDSMKEAQEKEYRYLQNRNHELRKERAELMGLNSVPTSPAMRLPAAENEKSAPSKSEILARHLQKSFQGSALKVVIDPQSAAINLSMKDFSLFDNNASELDEAAKKVLFKLLPQYFAALSSFSHSEDIKSINIIGHASPVFQRKFVDPKGTSRIEQEAYLFNLDISAYRAREIVKYVFDERFNKVENIAFFRSRLQSVGKSFNQPIKRSPSSAEGFCGPFDCDLSRRVELTVEFK